MAQHIPSNQFSHGAGKGPEERPIDRAKFRKNFDLISGFGSVSGKPIRQKNGKITYTYSAHSQGFTNSRKNK
jgi:hypothetical protein